MAVMLCLFGLYLSTSQGSQQACREFYRELFYSPAGLFLYGLLILNLLAVSVRVAFDSLAKKPPERKKMDAMVVLELKKWSEVRETLREFSLPEKAPEGLFYKKLRRWSFLPGTIFRLSIVCVLLSLLISVRTERRTEFLAHDGEDIKQLEGIQIKEIKAPLQADFLQIGEEGTYSLPEAEALVEKAGRVYRISSLMPEKVGAYYMRINHLGYYREIIISDEKGGFRINRELDLLPPGKTAIIPVSNRDYFITVTLSPERTIRKGILTGSQFNLKQPSFNVVIQRAKGKKQLKKAVLKDGQEIKLSHMSIMIKNRGLFARVLYVKNPAYAFLRGGLIALVLSVFLMVLRFFWFKKELLIEKKGDRIAVYYREEFYRKWAVTRFQRAFEGLSIV